MLFGNAFNALVVNGFVQGSDSDRNNSVYILITFIVNVSGLKCAALQYNNFMYPRAIYLPMNFGRYHDDVMSVL